MRLKKALSFQKGDLLAVAIVAALAALTLWILYAQSGTGQTMEVQIRQNGEALRIVPLNRDQTLTIQGDYTNTVTVENGRVAVTVSDCPGEDCVHSGWIGRAGHSIVCLPNRVEIRITGADPVDLAVG